MTRHAAPLACWLALLAASALGCSDSDDGNAAAATDAAGGSGGSGGSGGGDSGSKPTYPKLLSEAGLYDDVVNETLTPGVRFYEPRYLLWSDGSTKRRWFYLPPGTQIDTSDMDHWTFPVGTKAFKEFSRDGVRVETRMLHKVGPTRKDWLMIAYLWNDAQTEAEAVPFGAVNASGTPHDVPNTTDCSLCHDRVPDVLAGIGALQLNHDLGNLTLQALIDEGALTAPPASLPSVPGDEVAESALGYMHANCGLCHNGRNDVYEKTTMKLWLEVATLGSVETTPSYTTAVGVATQLPLEDGTTATQRIVAGDPDNSMVVIRMNRRAAAGVMPPLGTELIDDDGVSDVRAWITSLAPATGN